MRTNLPFSPKPLVMAVLSGTVALAAAGSAQAMEFDFGDDSEWSGKVDVTLGYAAAIRAQDSKDDPLNNGLNAASERRVPDAGDLISQVFKANAEIGLDWRNYGFVSNLSYQYDTEIMNGKQNDISDLFGPTLNGDNWTRSAENYAGNAFDVLDAYFYGSFDIGDNPLELRAGKQVVNWGEGLFFLDGVSIQVPLNINKLTTAGSELKEAFIGVNSVYAQMGIGDASSVEAYVQTEWRRAEFPVHGSFFGSDAFFRGGVEAGMRENDLQASDTGQWGISGRTNIGDTEYGLYYSRYHETFPFLQIGTGTPATIFGLSQVWPEDLDMYGASFSTAVGTWSLAGELAYRPDRPLFTNLATFNADGRNIEEHDTYSASVNGIWLGGQTFLGIDSQVGLVQFGVDYVEGDLTNLAPHNSITRNRDGSPTTATVDRTAYGVAAEWIGTWQGAYPGTDISLDLFLQKDLKGNSHFWGNFAEDRVLGAVGLTANIGNEWEASAVYSYTVQSKSDYEDLDNVTFSINYKF